MAVELRFLGTGAAHGTPGEGRSHRRESSLLATAAGCSLLVDATRHVTEQLAGVELIDGVVLTHGHRDASSGIAALDPWAADGRLPVFAGPETLQAVRGRHRPRALTHVEARPVAPGVPTQLGPWSLRAVEVPHADTPRFRTYAWSLAAAGRRFVYASDVGELTAPLEELTRGADLLVLDGAMYGKDIFSHLRIEDAVPQVCRWDVGRIVLTQLGRSVPPHEELVTLVQRLCPRAAPAYDGLVRRL